jgi:predicted AAA+ superfamily ATPase
LFEDYVVSKILRKKVRRRSDAELFFFRESNGNEIDLIVDRKSSKEHLEIRSSHTLRPEMPRLLIRTANQADRSMVLCGGKELAVGGGVNAVNFRSYQME